MLLVRTGHPHHKPILKLIHSLIENGIKIKRDKLYKESLLIFILYRWISYDERKKFIRRNEFSGQTNYEMLMLRMEI